MGCGCAKNKTQANRRALTSSRSSIRYEAFGGDLEAPENFKDLSDARTFASDHGAKLRSIVVGESAPATV